MKNNILEAKEISKSFMGVKALNKVGLDIREGEVHALVGENGAGKSTLIKIISGVLGKDAGEILIDGKPTIITSPVYAIKLGISCIYQELTIIPQMSVAKNLFLGNMPRKRGIINKKKMKQGALNTLKRINLDVNPNMLVAKLTVGQQQMVEIGRAISRDARLLIMDEPTSSLSEKETEVLFSVINELKMQNISILYVSHKLEEVLEISDRVTVLRDGEKITTVDNKGLDKESLIKYMIGRNIENYFHKKEVEIGKPIFRVENMSSKGAFKDISFEVKRGEILGFYGIVGAGRTEIMQGIMGIRKLDGGEFFIDDKRVKLRKPIDAIKNGICIIPEDRKKYGLAIRLSVFANIMSAKTGQISKFGFTNKKAAKELSEKMIKLLAIKTSSLKMLVNQLSGGNQQKIVIAKWLLMNPKMLILDEPTRGIDVGSKSEIYALMTELTKQGVGIIMVSSELAEIIGICDRVACIYEGEIAAILNKEEISSEVIARKVLGGNNIG